MNGFNGQHYHCPKLDEKEGWFGREEKIRENEATRVQDPCPRPRVGVDDEGAEEVWQRSSRAPELMPKSPFGYGR